MLAKSIESRLSNIGEEVDKHSLGMLGIERNLEQIRKKDDNEAISLKLLYDRIGELICIVDEVRSQLLSDRKTLQESFTSSANHITSQFSRHVWMPETYSQEGEDLFLQEFFQVNSGLLRSKFYLDIGAHHPVRFSNTKLLYDKGWRGINVEPNPDQMGLFEYFRCHDLNLNLAVGGESTKEMDFYRFNEPALNTFCLSKAQEIINADNPYYLVDVIRVKMHTVEELLDRYLSTDLNVELFNLDIEGLDLEVLGAIDWTKFRPFVVLAESVSTGRNLDINDDPITCLMRGVGYKLEVVTMRTRIFVDSNR